jgi:plasmid stabilization system protein ParE
MSHSIVLLRRAVKDLRSILRWIKRRSPRGMELWRDALENCLLEIAEDPFLFSRVTEGPALPPGIRQALFRTRRGNIYRVIFLIEQSEVQVLRIRAPGQRNLRTRDIQ